MAGSTVLLSDSNGTDGYVSIAANNFLQKLKASVGFTTVVNSSVSGMGPSHFVSNLNSTLIQHAPGDCLIMLGTNNVAAALENNADNDVMVSGYISSMRTLITNARAALASLRIQVISPGMSQLPEAGPRFDPLLEALRRLCADVGVGYVGLYEAMAQVCRVNKDTFNGFFVDSALDFWHYADPGHQFIHDVVLRHQFAYASAAPPAGQQQIPQTQGMIIGDMDAMSAAYDGVDSKASTACANGQGIGVVSYTGRHFTAPRAISGFVVHGSSEKGVADTAANVELQLWGRNGAAPAHAADGTFLGGSGTMADSNGLNYSKLNITPTNFDNVWVRVISTDTINIKFLSQVKFYEG